MCFEGAAFSTLCKSDWKNQERWVILMPRVLIKRGSEKWKCGLSHSNILGGSMDCVGRKDVVSILTKMIVNEGFIIKNIGIAFIKERG